MAIEHAPREVEVFPAGVPEGLGARTSASYERESRLHRATETWLRTSLAEQELLVSLKETQLRQQEDVIQQQKLLTRESDHRLLNDLQLIVSLLSMQARKTPNAEAASQLAAAASRVATIERVHRRLHCLDGVQSVAFKQYVEEFCTEFSAMLSPAERPEQMMIVVEGSEIELPNALAIPLGFIVNELLTNAVKHGGGRIVVSLRRLTTESCSLSVSNDGETLPESFDPAASNGLGMKIVQSFVGQIGGQFLFGRNDRDRGARFTVLFAVPAPSEKP